MYCHFLLNLFFSKKVKVPGSVNPVFQNRVLGMTEPGTPIFPMKDIDKKFNDVY